MTQQQGLDAIKTIAESLEACFLKQVLYAILGCFYHDDIALKQLGGALGKISEENLKRIKTRRN